MIYPGKPISKLPTDISIAFNANLANLYSTLSQHSKLSVNRLRITKGSDGSLILNNDNITIYDAGLRNQSTLYVKDLGLAAPSIARFPTPTTRLLPMRH